jgi:hypothetical protein
MIPNFLKLIVFSVFAIFGAALAAQEQLLLVAVLEPTGNTVVTALNIATVRGTVEEYISNSKKFKVVDRTHIDKIMAEQAFQRSGLTDSSKAKNLGGLLGADYICDIELIKDQGHFNAIWRVIKVETGEVDHIASDLTDDDTPMAIRELIRTLGARLFDPPVSAAPLTPQEKISLAKETINRLMPSFTFEHRNGGVTCTHRAYVQFASSQKQAVIDKKIDFWHSIIAEIQQGKLYAASRYEYGGRSNRLQHKRLTVNINGKAMSTKVNLKTNSSSIMGITTEEARISDIEILRFIAANPGGEVNVRIENETGVFRNYILNDIAQRAIAQTLELYDAMEELEKAGVEIDKNY